MLGYDFGLFALQIFHLTLINLMDECFNHYRVKITS